MIYGLPLAGLGLGSIPVIVILLLLTDKLVWYKRLQKAEERADKWENIALRMLGTTEKLTVHAEVTNEVLTRLPDPVSQALRKTVDPEASP